jgi:hypothetical protein
VRGVLPGLVLVMLSACTSEPAANNAAPVGSDSGARPPIEAGPNAAASNATSSGTPDMQAAIPEVAMIPAIFRGAWAESKPACAELGHHSRLVISGRTARFPDFAIMADSVTASGNQFALKGKVEGTGRPADAHYSINAAGNVLTDEAGGGAIRVRCE